MKTFRIIALLLCTLALATSCKKNDDSSDNLDTTKVSAKWVVTNPTDYISFEFNKSGNYIVVQNADKKSTNTLKVLFGTYEITDGMTLVLSNFGKIKVSSIDDASMNFTLSLTDNPSEELSLKATKKAEMDGSTKTDLLCRTWEMVTVDSMPVAGTEYDLTVLFSKAGTYLVSHKNYPDETGLAQWKWKNTSETQLLYSWSEVPDWGSAAYVDIPVLTETQLKIVEGDVVYVLKPATGAKSGSISSTSATSGRIPKGIFR